MRRLRSNGQTGSMVLSLAYLAGVAAAIVANPQRINLPQLDFDRLGDVLIAGSFDGISLLDYSGRQSVLSQPNATEDSIILQSSNDTYFSEPLTDGLISASCLLGDNHTAIIAGNFSHVMNESASCLAKLDLSSMTASSLGPSAPNTSVNALWCNDTEVYVGGSFEFGGAYGVAVWNSSNNSWSNPTFSGFTEGSSVNSIIALQDRLVFAGNMTGLKPLRSPLNSSSNSSELLRPGMQPVSFNFANATGYGTEASAGTDASAILCPYSNGSVSTGWAADLDSTTGYVNVTFGNSTISPTRIRLFNLPDGSGTKTWRLVTEPANGIMNLTYTDQSGKLQSCSAFCPLPENNSTVVAKDFELVNVVPTTSLRIELLDYYGSQAGLRGIQLFQEGQFAYANEAFNIPRDCGSTDASTEEQGSQTATATLQGSWSPIADYMTANITSRYDLDSVTARLSPTFNGYTVDRGRYAVQLWTPGCEQYDVCSQRGQVNVTMYPGFGSSLSTVLYQTNHFDKYDVIYNETLQDGAYIEIKPTSQNQLPMQLVAYKASLTYIGPPPNTNASKLFEFLPTNFSGSSSHPVGLTPINSLGEMMGNNATVSALLLNGSTNLLVGGNAFGSNLPSTNLLSLPLMGSANSSKEISGIDAGEAVSKLYAFNSSILALSTKETYNISEGAKATSMNVGAKANAALFNLDGTSFVALSPRNRSSNDITLWSTSANVLAPSAVADRVQGHLEASYLIGNTTVYFGSLRIVDEVALGGAVMLGSEKMVEPASLPFSFSDSVDEAQSLVKREQRLEHSPITGNSPATSVYAGVYLNSSLSILAGHFNASVSNNDTARNALLLSGNSSSPLPHPFEEAVNASSVIYAAASLNGTAALGGDLTGTFNASSVAGVLLFNSTAAEPFEHQPPKLSDNILVSALAFRPNSSDLVVGGTFSDTARVSNGSCSGLCVYNAASRSWFSPQSLELGPNAIVNDFVFETGRRLVLAGNFSLKDNKAATQVAIYDFSNNTLDPLPQLPGQVKSIVVVSNATANPVYAVSGLEIADNTTKPFVQWYSGSNKRWQDVSSSIFGPGTQLSRLSLVVLQNQTKSSSVPLPADCGLLLSGNLVFPGNQNASVAVFNGTNWQGVYSTTPRDSFEGHRSSGSVNTIYSQYGGDLKGGVQFDDGASKSHPRPSSHPHPSESPNNGGSGSHDFMPVGHVVGIACGIGVGCIMVLTLLYLLVEFLFNLSTSRVPYQNLAQHKSASDPMAGTKVL